MKLIISICLAFLVAQSFASVQRSIYGKPNAELKTLIVPALKLKPVQEVSQLETWQLMLKKVRTPAGNSIGCGACTFFFDSFTTFLEGDTSVLNNVVAAVQKICTQFPAAIEPQCIDFLAQYGTASLALTIEQLDPKQVCTEMKACDASDAKAMAAIPAEKASLNQCATCATFMDAFQKEIYSPTGQQEIITQLDKICVLLPAPYNTQCSNLLTTYSSFLFEALASLTADTVCPLINMCPK